VKTALSRILAALLVAAPVVCASAIAGPSGDAIKTIDVPGGGHIMLGTLAGQLTPQTAMGRVLHAVSQRCGDRPQIGRLLQAQNGEILAVFFTVNAKNQDNRRLAGLAITSAPKAGPASAALLFDEADRFPSTLNALFERLKQEIGTASSSQTSGSSSSSPASNSSPSFSLPAPTAPAAPLQTVRFSDGTGVIGLPMGWNVVFAQKGDVFAKGPKGEALRFGMVIPVVDPQNPQSHTLGPVNHGTGPGNFVAIPFGADASTAFKSASAQLAQKNRKEPTAINIGQIQQFPASGGGRIYMLAGEVDSHDGQGPVNMIAQLLMSSPQPVGTWQMTVYQVNIPKPLFAQEAATVAKIFPSYSVDSHQMIGIINREMEASARQTSDFINHVNKQIEDSDRMTQGFSDFLRSQSVIRDTQEGGHARTSDDLAQMLINADPNRFEVVPPSQYLKGIDFD
jgi:hypothetical protein